MSDQPIWSLTATKLVAGFRCRDFTPSDSIEAVLARLEAVNNVIKAVVTINADEARSAAAAATQRWRDGQPFSPLDGVPLTIKDNLHASGLKATWGSRAFDGFVPTEDEPPIARLRAAGAVVIGKTNVPEFTLQGYTDNLLFGATRNPHALDCTPGGSTGGGAAAVAAGIGPIAIGTDGGGSLRRPAAHCGLFAFKPSIGQIARYGGFPQLLSDFEVVGPIARTAEDLALAFAALRGFDPRDPRTLAALSTGPAAPIRRIGYFRTIGNAPVDQRILKHTDRFAASLAIDCCTVEPIEAPFDLEATNAAWGAVAATGLAWFLDQHPDFAEHLGSNAIAVAEAGRSKTTAAYLDALAFAADSRVRAGALFGQFDLLLCPTTAALAWPTREAYPPTIDGREVGPRGHAIFTAWANITGLPAAAIPVAMTTDAGGIGVQLIAAAGRDLDLLDFLCNAPAIHALGTAGLSQGLVAS